MRERIKERVNNMKKNLKKVLAMLLAVIMTLGLAGCGEKFDATAYVKAELDLLTKHDVEQYVKELGVSKEEAEEIYVEAIDELNIAEEILEDDSLPQELYDGYEKWFIDVLAKTKYTVLDAKEVDGNYIVNVEVEPVKAFEGIADVVTTKTTAYMQDLMAQVMAGAEMPSDEQMNIDMYNMILDIMNEILENATYAEKTVVETRIIKNSDGEYEVDEASFEELGAKLIDVSEMEEMQ